MRPPADRDPADRPGFWQRLFGRDAGAAGPPPPAPLFQLRPVPQLPPKGPGLPAWEEILSAAPPVPEPMARPPRPTLVPDPEPPGQTAPAEPPPAAAPAPPAPAAAGLVVPAAAPVAAADSAGKRPPDEAERRVLAQLGTLLGAGQIAQAAALLDAELRDRPEVCDARGRPVYLMESLHCALRLGAAATAAERAQQLRPHLAPDDPLVELLYARTAIAAGDRAAARANWRAALARAPELAEAKAWLAANPISPDGGVPAVALLGAQAQEWAGRIQPPPSLAPPPQAGAAVPDWSPGRLLANVALSVGEDGAVRIVPAADAPAARPVPATAAMAGVGGGRDLALVLRHPEGVGRAHAFGEVLLAAFVLQRQYLPHLRPARVYVGRQPWVLPAAPPDATPPDATPPDATPANAAAAAQAEMLAALFPGVRVTGDHEGALREAAVLVVDGALRNPATGTLIGGMMPQVVQWAADARARVHAACGLPEASEPARLPGRRPRVLYAGAAPPRTLAEPVRERLFGLFAAAGYEVAAADVAALPWHRQVRLAYGADIVTGVHGPAMDMALWAHPQTRVLEFFPEGTRRYDGQLLAEAAGLAYRGSRAWPSAASSSTPASAGARPRAAPTAWSGRCRGACWKRRWR